MNDLSKKLSKIKTVDEQRLIIKMVRVTGVEPASRKALDPKSSASANSATPARVVDPIGLEPMTARL